MDWRDEGILLWVRRHGEANAIIETLTAGHGRHAGLVRGGGGKSHAAVLQPGAQLSLEWSARLAEHLGTYKVDLVKSRAAQIMSDRYALAALNAISALLVKLLPEREPDATVYQTTLALADAMGDGDPAWPVRYARWEFSLLEALGYGLDLSSCAATGQTDDLVYVSPRSGRAVCRSAGAPFADRMLPLPAFLQTGSDAGAADVREALRTSGYFLENWVCREVGLDELPPARRRFTDLFEGFDAPLAPVEPPKPETYSAAEEAWLAQWDDPKE